MGKQKKVQENEQKKATVKKRNAYYDDENNDVKFSVQMLKKTLRYAVPYKKLLVVTSVLLFLVGFLALVPATLNKYVVDYVLTKAGYAGGSWQATLVVVLVAWVSIVIADVVFSFVRTVWMSRVGHSIVRDVRKDTYTNLQKLSFEYFDTRPMGRTLVRVTNYLDGIANIFSNAVITALVDCSKIAMLLVWLFVVDWRLTLVVVGIVVPMFVVLIFVRRAVVRTKRVHRNKDSNRTSYVAENISGAFVTKAFNRGAYNAGVHKGLCLDVQKNWMKFTRRHELFWPVGDGFFMMGTILVYGMAIAIIQGWMGSVGALSVGTLLAFVSYMGMFASPINNIATVMQKVSVATSNLERVFELAESDIAILDKEDAYPLPTIEGVVKFDNVSFAYDEGVTILDKVNLEVPKGSMYALVGPTGAGKTTLVSLISRFYEVESGTVSIDGHDVSKVTQESLRRQVGVMMQDSFIFSGTILENIRYARPEATEAECIQAAKKVYAHDFISKLPQGYHTKTLEQGQGLSTGQRQLISFARVILTDPKILILDEATSSIDTETEAKIKKVLEEVLVGRTSFVIAHRLSTIRKADKILFVADKGICESGTHEQLMALGGRYHKLVTTHG